MVRTFFRFTSSVTSTVCVLLMGAAMVACSSDSGDGGAGGGNECLPDPECVGCVADGDCCVFSINCGPGRICNRMNDDLYDPSQDEDICIRVICDTDEDCDDGKLCGRDRLCRAPICQTDDDCTGQELCLNGTCQEAPNAEQIASCRVVTPATSIVSGATVTLTAAATAQGGATLGGVTFTWTSSDDAIVSVEGNVATGGTTEGTATLTAQAAGSDVRCDGSVDVTTLAGVPAASVRVVVVEDGAGTPVDKADVIISTETSSITVQTSGEGVAVASVAAEDVAAVTVSRDGYQLFTVIRPGSDDVFIPLPKVEDVTVAGGFRGVIDLSLTREADIKFGFAGPAIPSNILDFGAEALLGDILPTEISSPELGIDDTFPLPGGLVFALGTDAFTAVESRCGSSINPGMTDLGCFLARAPGGVAAGWALGGQVRLGDITGLINEISGLLGGSTEDLPLGQILTGALPLLRRFNHGLNASLSITEVAKVGECEDPSRPDFDEVCQADFDRYQRQDLQLTQGLNVLSAVQVPNLPQVPSGACAGGAAILTASNLPGRGLIPLGLSAALVKEDDASCQVAGISEPFGPGTADVADGRMALSSVPPHSGLEGSQTLMLLLALDLDQLIASAGVGFQVSGILNRVSRIDTNQTVTGSFLPYPEGTVRRTGQLTFEPASLAGVTVTRAEIQREGRTWLVYAPGSATTVTLPDVAAGRTIIEGADDVVVLTMKTRSGVSYGDVWQFASGATIDRLFDIADAFVVSDCPSEDDSAACRLE